jgi:hypothetical protein
MIFLEDYLRAVLAHPDGEDKVTLTLYPSTALIMAWLT